jgi:transposase
MATPLDDVGWCNGPDDDHRYRVFGYCYGDVPQRWVLVHSTPRQRHDHAAQQRKFATEREEAEKSSRALSRRRFACEADANAAATQMSSSWRFHKASHQLVAHSHYEGRGRPKKDQPPDHVLWQVLVDVVDDEAAFAEALVGCGMYVVATNVLEASVLPASSMIELYREQGVSVERGFRFLKDPLFFASSLFLHKPSRIMALLMIMTLSLLVYCLCERHLREQLAQTAQTVPDQKGKPTSTPTLRRVFQMFDGIDLLTIRDDSRVVRQILNLTDQHRHILGLFPAEVQTLYEDPQEHSL